MIIVLDDDTRSEILRELQKTRSAARVSRRVGCPIEWVLEVLDQDLPPLTRFPERNGGYGRPEMQQYMVARKYVSHLWDNEKPELALARSQKEAGTHEMCTGRDGDWIILYSIPRETIKPAPGYFSPNYDGGY